MSTMNREQRRAAAKQAKRQAKAINKTIPRSCR